MSGGGAPKGAATRLVQLLVLVGVFAIVQVLFVLVAMTAVFLAACPLMPFTKGMPLMMVLGLALLWGTLSITRSPSALLGVLAQTRAQGPVATFSLAFILSSDVVVVV